MNCIAIDDEPLALNVIEEFCKRLDFLALETTCNSAIEAINYLNKNKVDLIFLDIEMPHITGLQFLASLDHPPMVIFTTAYSEYAVEGFNLNAIDYLVKPFAFDRFLKAVNKANELFELKSSGQYEPAPSQGDYIMINVEYSTIKVNYNDISYIEGLKDYLKIVTAEKNFLTKSTMKNLEEKLPSDKFFRIHKSFIISLDKIDKIENHRVVIANKYIPVGNHYKDSFYEYIKQFKL